MGRTKEEILKMNPARFNTANPQDAMDMEFYYLHQIKILEKKIEELQMDALERKEIDEMYNH